MKSGGIDRRDVLKDINILVIEVFSSGTQFRMAIVPLLEGMQGSFPLQHLHHGCRRGHGHVNGSIACVLSVSISHSI